MVVKDGRFGPYVTDGETNASLRVGDEPASLSPERGAELLQMRRDAVANGEVGKKPAKKTAKKTAKKPAKKATTTSGRARAGATTGDGISSTVGRTVKATGRKRASAKPPPRG
jgi:DNA topoisomerase-1